MDAALQRQPPRPADAPFRRQRPRLSRARGPRPGHLVRHRAPARCRRADRHPVRRATACPERVGRCLDRAAAGQGPRVPPGRGRPCGARPHPPVRVGAAAGLRRPGLRLGRPERHRRRPELHWVCLSRRGVPGADALPGPGHGRQHRLVAGPHERQDPARLQQWPRRLHQRQPAGVSRTGRRVPAQEARQEVRERRPDLQRGQPQRPARLHRSATAEVCRGPRPGRAQRAHPGPGSPPRLRPGPAHRPARGPGLARHRPPHPFLRPVLVRPGSRGRPGPLLRHSHPSAPRRGGPPPGVHKLKDGQSYR